MMTIEDIFETLLDGTKSQIEALAGSGVSCRYSEKSGAFTVFANNEEMRAHKVYDPPNCVKVFGPKHSFTKPAEVS